MSLENSGTNLVIIVEQCFRLDNLASRIYQLLALNACSDHSRSFWQQIAESKFKPGQTRRM